MRMPRGAPRLNMLRDAYECSLDSSVLTIATGEFVIAGEWFAGLIRFTLNRSLRLVA